MDSLKSLVGAVSAAVLVGVVGIGPIGARAEADADALDTIRVVAPRVTVEQAPIGVSKVITAEMRAHVSFADLDLGRAEDLRRLEARVSEAATDLCEALKGELPFGQPSTQACHRRAVEGTRAQIREAAQLAMR